ncbi:extracellular solute-binding protein [Paenibacillus sp. NPDC058071]|uniref:extracellular solute-binding protein n=1 Tax=Paenibacillus sp. NPDC058071 TaxID=3346326 RepID=UPI0036D7F1F8
MKKWKKPLLVAASLMLVLTAVLAGCSSGSKGGNNQPGNTATDKPSDAPKGTEKPAEDDKWVLGEKPLTFSLYAHYKNSDFPQWESRPLGKWLKEERQVTVNVISAAGDHTAKLNTLITSNQLPDIIWGDKYDPDIERLRENGMLVSFDEYLDKYTNLRDWMGDLNMLRSDDGKLYMFPNWYTGRPAGNAGYVINKKIYEELGSPTLETTDDLYEYLKKVRDKYGKEIVPFEPHRAQDAQGLGVLYTAFGEGASYTHLSKGLRAVPQGDKLTSIFTDPVFREAEKYIAKLFREKLISQDAFTQTEDMVKEKVMNGKVAVFAGASPTTFAGEAQEVLTKNDPNAGYFMIWPIHKPGLDKNKIYPGTYTTLGWNAAYITKNAKDPEALFAFLDWMTGPEGMNVQFFGPEGGNWEGFDANGQPNFTANYNAEEVKKIQSENDAIMLVGNTGYIDPSKMKYILSVPEEQQDWRARYQYKITWPTQQNATEFIGLNPQPDSELGIIKQSIDDLFLEVYANVTSAKSDEEVDKILDKAEADAQKLGYGKLLEYRTELWQANKAKLAGK